MTYGASGTTEQREKTIEIVSRIKADHGLEAMAHFTCVGASVEDLRRTLDRMRDAGIENVLALRGDPPQGLAAHEWTPTENGLNYSRELIELIRAEYDFAVGAACFPEVHLAAESAETDLRYTREKVDAGARFLITQLFFDNQCLLGLRRPRARRRDRRPDHPRDHADHQRRPDPALHQHVRRDDPARAACASSSCASSSRTRSRDFGVAYATMQCADLLANGAPGIHFYTLNRSPSTRAILSALRCLAPWRGAAVTA